MVKKGTVNLEKNYRKEKAVSNVELITNWSILIKGKIFTA
jgi:hypothetical protein